VKKISIKKKTFEGMFCHTFPLLLEKPKIQNQKKNHHNMEDA
jgi:hypothetical protein